MAPNVLKAKKNQQVKKQAPETPLTETPKDKKTSGTLAIILAILTAAGTLVAISNGLIELDQKVKEAKATLTPLPTMTLTLTPALTNTPLFTPGPLTFFEMPTEIQAGNDVQVVVQAWEGATCNLDFYTGGNNNSNAEGLGLTSPDSLNQCKWTWHVNANTHEGTGRIIVKVGELEEEHTFMILPAK